MIKFFRRIRKKLLEENRLSKYLVYAGGEIILVVIGIMIALQVNNWNEKRKVSNTIETLVDKVEEDVISDIKNINNIIAFYEEREFMMQRVLTKQVTADDYHNFEYMTLLFNYSDFDPNTENLDKLLKLEEAIKSAYSPIIEDIKRLKSRKKYKDLAWNDLQKAFANNMDHYSLNGNNFVFRADSSSFEKTINLYLTDTDYINRMANYLLKYHNILFEARSARALLVRILVSLKQAKHQFNKEQLDSLLNSLGLNHYEEINCNTTSKDYEDLKGTRQWLLIFNTRKDTLSVKVTDKYDNELYNFKLGQGAITMHETPRGGLLNRGDYSKVVTIYKDGTCLAKFTEQPHGYIIIDNSN